MPAVAIAAREPAAPATPTTIPATETMPSFAPSTAARSQFSRPLSPAVWGSPAGNTVASALVMASIETYGGPGHQQGEAALGPDRCLSGTRPDTTAGGCAAASLWAPVNANLDHRRSPARSVSAMKPGRRALAQWRRRTEWPLVAAAVLFLAAYAVPILHRGASPLERHVCTGVLIATWAAFGVDYAARLFLDTARRKHVSWYALDLLILVVPIFPIFKFLRVLRLLILFRVVNRKAAVALQGRVAAYVGGTAVLVIFCAALAELDAERHSHATGGPNIHSFGDALWWAVSTVTTVGYGDKFPTTVQGRLVAVGLMFAGIALIGLVTASFASWLIARVRQDEAESRAATAEDLHTLRLEITALRQDLGLRSVKAAPPPPEKKKTG